MHLSTDWTYMSPAGITEKLVKATLGMIENNDDGIILPLELLLARCPDLPITDSELLYTACKVAAETATSISSCFTREVIVAFIQREQFVNDDYAPDCTFEITWAP